MKSLSIGTATAVVAFFTSSLAFSANAPLKKQLTERNGKFNYQLNLDENVRCAYLPKISALKDSLLGLNENCDLMSSFDGTAPKERFWHQEAQELKTCLDQTNFVDMQEFCKTNDNDQLVISEDVIKEQLDFIKRSPKKNLFLKLAIIDKNHKIETYKVHPGFTFSEAKSLPKGSISFKASGPWSKVSNIEVENTYYIELNKESLIPESEIECVLNDINGDYWTKKLDPRFFQEMFSIEAINSECSKGTRIHDIETKVTVSNQVELKTIHRPLAGLSQIFNPDRDTAFKEWYKIKAGYKVSQVKQADVRKDTKNIATDLVIITNENKVFKINLKPELTQKDKKAAMRMLPKAGDKIKVK